MSSRRKPSVFGKVADNLIRQREIRLIQEREALGEFSRNLDKESDGIPWKPYIDSRFRIRFLVQPNKSETKKGIKPKWLSKPLYRHKMQAGIWIKHGKGFRLLRMLHLNPTDLRSSNIASLKKDVESAYNSIPENQTSEISVSGYTLFNALTKIAINLDNGDRLAINCQIKYTIKDSDDTYRSSATSYVENFDNMRDYKTLLQCFVSNLASKISSHLAYKEVTFTNHKNMEQIYSSLLNKTEFILAKYGIDYIPDATAKRMANMVLNASGYDKLSDAKVFNDTKVIKDYEHILELYMPEKQLEAKLEKDEIERVSIYLTYTKIPRIKRA